MIRFQGLHGDRAGEAFEFDKDCVVVGRSDSCDLTIDDPTCSRRHARIERFESEYHIFDLGSRNGLQLNGEKTLTSRLRYGDRFAVGNNLFVFLSEIVGDGEEENASEIEDILAPTEMLDVHDAERFLDEDVLETDRVFLKKDRHVRRERAVDVQRVRKQMRFVRRMSQELNRTLEKEGLLQTVTRSILSEFQSAENVAIFVAEASDPSVLEEATYVSRSANERPPISQSVLRRVERERVSILSGNAVGDQRFAESKSIHVKRVRSFMCAPLLIGAKLLGLIYVENHHKVRAFDRSDLELLTVLANQAATALGNALLYEDLQVSFFETVRSLSNALEAKDTYTRGHSDRVAQYSVGIGKQLGLQSEQLNGLEVAAGLHDIGKIAITERIIGKNGRLTQEEFRQIRKHPELGVEILRPIRLLKPILPFILHHHERYNGRGYPAGLKGKEIPLEARIINLADAFDAMTTQRSYNKPVSVIDGLARCKKEAGVSFDRDCVEALLRHLGSEQDARCTAKISLAGNAEA